MIKIIFKIIEKYKDFEEIFSSAIGVCILKSIGVKVGIKLTLKGIPSVYLAENSMIQIGDYCVLRSKSRNNSIAINHKIIIRTERSDSIIKIGNHTGVSGCAICAKKSVLIGSNCLIGANVTIADNDFHSFKPENRRYNRNEDDILAKPITIGNNVWIGANSYILKGVVIGENSVVGAMSVVTKSVPANCIVAGNPAKIIKNLCENES